MAAIPSSPLIQDLPRGAYHDRPRLENSSLNGSNSDQTSRTQRSSNGTFLAKHHEQEKTSDVTADSHPSAHSVNKPLQNTDTLLPENVPPRFLGDIGRNGSEPDSLIELYRQQRGETGRLSAEDSRGMDNAANGDDLDSKWVHRDKLTMIEIQEYKDRGMDVPAELLVRAGIRPDSRRSKKSRQESQERGAKDGKRQRVRSPSPGPVEEDYSEQYVPDDPRTPEEIAADPYEESHQDAFYQQAKLRSSSSRIPLATTSPHPIPSEHIERSTPLPRKRAQSNGDVEEGSLLYSKTRSRGNSISSQILLDDSEALPASPESPSKNAAKSRSRKTSATIKVVPNSSSANSRTPSATVRNSPARPTTRSGPDSRPRTSANPPEGDPPWLDQMYKPDPRLPPDKQMLPTHAKRMMQEQWEREGKSGSIYDRNFTPVAIADESNLHEKPLPTPTEKQPQPPPKREDSLPSEWPIKQSSNPETPKSPASEHAGYSTMPKLQNMPSLTAVPSPRIQRPEEPLQVEQPEKKKKGCGCCVIM